MISNLNLAIKDEVTEIKLEQRYFIADAHWKTIYQWLSPPDPSSNHNNSCLEHQPTTGDWFIDSNKFMTWKTVSNSVLWLHGIRKYISPVACLTFERLIDNNSWVWQNYFKARILCPGPDYIADNGFSSTIIENLTQHCKLESETAVVYFYFDFHDKEKKQYQNLVRSLIVQLSMQCVKTPESVEALFSRNLDGLKQPAISTLIYTLKKILIGFREVFVIIDALDECEDRGGLLGLLEEMFDWKLKNLHVLVTSRKEREIEDSFEAMAIEQVPIQSENVNPDIRIYISEEVQKDPKLKKWPANVKKEIEDSLMARADGM